MRQEVDVERVRTTIHELVEAVMGYPAYDDDLVTRDRLEVAIGEVLEREAGITV